MSARKESDAAVEKVGTVKRFLLCRVSEADKAKLADAADELLDRQKDVRATKLRLKAALAKTNERLKLLDEEIYGVHECRKVTEVERAVSCVVERTDTAVRVRREDTGAIISTRAFTKEEHAALHPNLPGTGPLPVVTHDEAVEDDDTKKRLSEEEEHAAKVQALLQNFDVDAALQASASANDAGDDEDEPEEPKGKKGGKGKGKKPPKETVPMFPDKGGK